MKVTLILHGHLRKLCPINYVFDVATPLEALKALAQQVPELRRTPKTKEILVKVLGHESEDAIKSPLRVDELHIVPMLMGGKSGGGFFKIALGVALIALSFYVGGLPGGMLFKGTMFEMSAGSILFSGVMMLDGGLLEMVSAAPQVDTSYDTMSDPAVSKYLGAPGNTTKIGTRIPIGYGIHKVSGQYLSFDIQAKDVAV